MQDEIMNQILTELKELKQGQEELKKDVKIIKKDVRELRMLSDAAFEDIGRHDRRIDILQKVVEG